MAVVIKSAEKPCLSVRDLRVDYRTPSGITHAIRGVALDVYPGEILGIAGESGCGKSTLANAVAGLLRTSARVSTGQVWLRDIDLISLSESQLRAVRWKKVSIVPQSAMNNLSPVLRVGDQVADAIRAHEHISRRVAMRRVQELFHLVHIDPARASNYAHELSGGMRQRVVIAMALALSPELVILDEPTTALDVVVQAAILQEVKALQQSMGFSVVFITHDLPLLLQLSDRIAVMYAGKIVEVGSSRTFAKTAQHPYSQLLMKAFPPLLAQRKRAEGIPGSPPDLHSPPVGCAFADRCPKVMDRCRDDEPGEWIEEDHLVSCYLYMEMSPNGDH